MNKFTVTWHNAAIDELASAWLDSPHRPALAKAVATIDDTLAHDPSTKGTGFLRRSPARNTSIGCSLHGKP